MKTLEKRFTVELTEKEIAVIVTALHSKYVEYKTVMKETGHPDADAPMVKALRNDLGQLINRTYMGEEA